jgi:integration host factor subunit beta
MTKSELIQAIASSLQHLPARDVEVVVNTMIDSMTNALQGGDRIEIRGFGSFSVRDRRSRQGRNPKTGETISVPAKRVPFFTVGHELKKRINASAGFECDDTPEVELQSAAE